MSIKYYLYFNRDKGPVLWNSIEEEPPLPIASANYLREVLKVMEQRLDNIRSLTVYITWDEVDQLPSYGRDVVVVVLGDEWARMPRYVDKVNAIFKCYGTNPILGVKAFPNPLYLNYLTFINFLGIYTLGIPYKLNFLFQKLRASVSKDLKLSPVYQIPLGYCNQIDLPIKDISERLVDVSFNGSIVHKKYPFWSFKQWLDSPKSVSRGTMVNRLRKFQESHPEVKTELGTTAGFRASKNSCGASYSQKLMETKICLAPRGNAYETYRFFEAIRYGCVVLTEALPETWFYDDSPAIRVSDWSQLDQILEQLINDQALVRSKHEEALNWWKKVCSEDAVGTYMADILNKSLA